MYNTKPKDGLKAEVGVKGIWNNIHFGRKTYFSNWCYVTLQTLLSSSKTSQPRNECRRKVGTVVSSYSRSNDL